MQTIHIYNQELPFSFSYKCLREFVRQGGDADDMLAQQEKAFVLGINNGYKKEESTRKITLDQLVDLIDEDPKGLQRLIQALAHDMEQFSDTEGADDGGGK